MSDIVDGLGTLGEGTLTARAVEPQRGQAGEKLPGGKGHFRETACLNCDTPLVGPYCHACGQQAHLHKTVGAFLHDLLHGVLHFEGKTWRTLPMLAWKPGELTRCYIDGHRARYVSPMALFLFGVFLMFAVFQAAGISPPVDLEAPDVRVPAQGVQEAQNSLHEQQQAIERRLDALPPGDPQREALQSELAGLKKGEEFVTLAEGGNWRINAVRTGTPFFDHLIEKWQKNPSLMLYKLQANSYKFSWLLIPLSLPFVALLFAWRRRFGLYDHAVFVTYSLGFVTLLLVALTIAGQLGVGWAITGTIMAVVPVLHMYRQLRGAYELTRFSAFWRTFVLSGFILMILVTFLNLLVVLGAF